MHIEATPNNMRKFGGPGVFSFDPETNERFSADAGDYFMRPPDEPLKNEYGSTLFLARSYTVVEVKPIEVGYDDDDIKEAYEEGMMTAEAAASWAADGNTNQETISRVLSAMEGGDPEVYDWLPRAPNLSGEFADDLTPTALAERVTGEESPDEDTISALADAFEEGVSDHFEMYCEAELRRWTTDEEEA